MIKFALSFVLLIFTSSAFANTFYVRTDGASPAYCSGLVNAPYSPSVVNKACALAHLMYLLPPNRDGNDVGRKPLIAGGDTVIIAAGSYQFGLPFNGGSWGSCSTSWPYDCHMQPVPSGTAANPTRIIGAGSTSTTFWGSGGASFVVNLSGSSNVVLQGIEITDHSNCIQNHTDATVKCQAGGLWAATGISDTEGGVDTPQSSNVALSDIRIHGMGKFGLLAGDINGWTLNNVKIIANGFGGWSLDTGKSFSSGTNTITNVEIGWNGCTENYPATTIYACWGQQSGGYGDGVGSSSASDQGTWNFSQISVHDNTQDGLDFLHASPSANITFDHVTAKNNAGNQLKTNGTVTISNSVVVGNCASFVGVGSMQGNNSGGGGTSGDICRAQGDTIVPGQSPNLTTNIVNNTIISEGNTLVTIPGPGTGFGDKTSKLNIANNILIGQTDWIKNDGSLTDIWWWGDGTPVNTPTLTNNVIFNTKTTTCPAGNTCADPKLTNETLVAFDPTPTAATPAGVGAIQTATPPPPPPPVTCNGGAVVNAVCYCPIGTTLNAGTCGVIAPVCKPVPVCTETPTSMSCTAACQ